MCKAIKQGSRSAGYFFVLWNDCDEALKAEYIVKSELPDKRLNCKNKAIIQMSADGTREIKSFASCKDVVAEFRTSYRSINQSIANETLFQNCRWKFAEA